MFTFADTTCDVDIDGVHQGEIAGGMGGHLILRDSIRHLDYVLRPDKVWHLYQAELKKIDEANR